MLKQNSTLDTDNRFFDYRIEKRIPSVVKEYLKLVEADQEEVDLAKSREEYLRLAHTFRLWDYHFWMPWTEFEEYAKLSKEFTDTSIYLPCDCADRQCAMTCAYFLGECPRAKEELRAPEILGFEGRWEFHDDGIL